jgi:hypothetical protein
VLRRSRCQSGSDDARSSDDDPLIHRVDELGLLDG